MPYSPLRRTPEISWALVPAAPTPLFSGRHSAPDWALCHQPGSCFRSLQIWTEQCGPSNATVLISGDPFVRTSPSEPREPALLNILPPAPCPLSHSYSICSSGELYQLRLIEKNFTCFFQNPSCCKFILSFEINLLSTAHLCTPAPNYTHIRKKQTISLVARYLHSLKYSPFLNSTSHAHSMEYLLLEAVH